MTTVGAAPDVVAAYRARPGVADELLGPDGAVRAAWAPLAAALTDLGPAGLAERARAVERLLAEDGATYQVTTGEVPGPRPWRTDPVPLVLDATTWTGIEAGVAQRAELLDLVLRDLYGPRSLITDGLLPPEVVAAHPGFCRPWDQVTQPGPHQLLLVATDLARGPDGRHVVLGDRTQAPSGFGYALENRLVTSRVLPQVHRRTPVQRLAPFLRALRSALTDVAPATDGPPRIVVLTPGPWSETAYEHALLAARLGTPLVQGRDLRVRDGRVWMRSLGRLEPVHVILRRVDAEWCDPVELRPDSTLGVPGLVEAARTGAVTVVNGLGSGVLENPGLLPFLGRIAQDRLGQDLLLPSVATWWCGDPTARGHVLARLDQLVLKPIGREVGTRPLLGWTLTQDERDDLAARITAEPHAWVGQEALAVGTAPAFTGTALEPRRCVLRTFAVAREDRYSVLAGGLTRVAPDAEGLVVSNQAGAPSKDTWVLADRPERGTGFWLQAEPGDEVPPAPSISARGAEHLFWLSRYAERAETLARLLRVVADRRAEFAGGPADPLGQEALAVLLRAVTHVSDSAPGFLDDPGLQAGPDPELHALLADGDRPGTLAFDVRRMLEDAAEVRDQLSGDTWLVVGHLQGELDALARLGPTAATAADRGALDRVVQALLALAGLATESMVRDPGWQFLDAGRRLERALQVTLLLEATVGRAVDPVTDSLVLESTLTAAESIITYRRRARGRARLDSALDLLVTDVTNPRALAHQTEALARAVAAMPPTTGGVDLAGLARSVDAVVVAADTRSLAATGADGSRPGLVEWLAGVRTRLMALADALDAAHFAHQVPQRSLFTPHDPGPR